MSSQGLPQRIVTTGLIVFLSALCAAFAAPTNQEGRIPAKKDESLEHVRTDEFEGVIIPREKAAEFMKAFSPVVEKEPWTPDRGSVLKLEEKIESYLKKAAAKRSPALWSKLGKYRRQYVGVVRGGRKVIFANFFCDSLNYDWKVTAVTVLDGGDCFFTVLYDPGSSAFSGLQINGEA